MPDFYMMVGLPGSGKTTWIKNNMLDKDVVICSSDDLIQQYADSQGKTYDEVFPDYVDQAIQLTKNKIQYALQDKKNILIDQTNLTPKSRKTKLPTSSSYKKIAIVIPLPDKEEWKRRLNRPGKNIPQDVLDRMLNSYVSPSKSEGFDEIWQV